MNITLQFPNIEKKTSWEAAFAAAKQKLGNHKDLYSSAQHVTLAITVPCFVYPQSDITIHLSHFCGEKLLKIKETKKL